MAGEILKKRREELGLTVQEIAEKLKIRAEYLSAIESDDFEKLPVPVYTVGYIRSYAKYLKVDSGTIVQFYNERLSQPQSATIMPVAFSRKKSPRIFYVIGVILGLAVIFYLLPQINTFRSWLSSNKAPSADKALPEQMQQHGGPVAAPKGRPLQTKGHDLDITAEETTWLSIKFKDGRKEEALLRPGDSKTWRFPETATLKIGNAGGVRITFDGNNLGAPGETGEVMTLSFPENKEDGQLTSP